MVDAQTVGILVTATSVTVAAIYYVLTLRTNQRNMRMTLETRQINLVDNLSTRIISFEGTKNYFELMNYEWTNYEDFENKYGSDKHVDAASKRYSLFSDYNQVGTMMRKGIITIEDLYNMGMLGVMFLWAKYRGVIEEGRRRYNGRKYMTDFEYLAGEMLRYVKASDPNYRLPETLTKYVPNK